MVKYPLLFTSLTKLNFASPGPVWGRHANRVNLNERRVSNTWSGTSTPTNLPSASETWQWGIHHWCFSNIKISIGIIQWLPFYIALNMFDSRKVIMVSVCVSKLDVVTHMLCRAPHKHTPGSGSKHQRILNWRATSMQPDYRYANWSVTAELSPPRSGSPQATTDPSARIAANAP